MRTVINDQSSMNNKKYFVFQTVRKATLLFLFLSVSSILSREECRAQGTWATKTSMPIATPFWMAATSAGGNLYVAGGNNGSPLSTCYKYNSATNSWSSIASLPETIYQGDGLGAIGGKLYLPGGGTDLFLQILCSSTTPAAMHGQRGQLCRRSAGTEHAASSTESSMSSMQKTDIHRLLIKTNCMFMIQSAIAGRLFPALHRLTPTLRTA